MTHPYDVRAEETTTCPRCYAQPGDQCRTAPRGRQCRNPHKVRIEAMESNDELTFSVPEDADL